MIAWNDKESREFFELESPFAYLWYRIMGSRAITCILCAYHALMNHTVIMNARINEHGAAVYLPAGTKGIVCANVIHAPDDANDSQEEDE